MIYQRYLSLAGRFVMGLAMCVAIALIAGPGISATSKLPTSVLGQLPSKTEAQKELKSDLSRGRYKKSYLLWDQALGNDPITKSPNGRALHAFLQFSVGLQTEALGELTQLDPKKLSPALLKVWREAAHPKHFVWRTVSLDQYNQWEEFFSEPRKERPLFQVKSKSDLKKISDKMSKSPSRDDKAWLQWQMAVGASIIDENQLALESYEKLLTEPQASVPREQVLMAQARTFFQMNRFDDAISSYQQISKSSDFWLEALEEKAWAQVRLENYDKALAHLKTLLAPLFAPQLGPEPYFMRALVAVQRCDFPMVFESFKDFRSSQKPRIKNLQALKSKKPDGEQNKNLNKLASGQLNWASIGADVERFPHLFHRDELFTRQIAQYAQAKKENKMAQELLTFAKDEELNSLGLLQKVQASKARANELNKVAYPRVLGRLSDLATEDLDNLSDLLQKLHVLEAEAIQRMYIFDEKNPKKLVHRKISPDEMVFPDNGEVWLDELTNYEVRSKGCPKTRISGQISKREQ